MFHSLHLMGLSHGYTSKRFGKRWNHPSDNHIGFRYRKVYVLFADLIKKRQFTFYNSHLYSSLKSCDTKEHIRKQYVIYFPIYFMRYLSLEK